MKKLLLLVPIMFMFTTTKADAAYSVKSGDSMWKISNKYNMSYSDLVSLNPQISNVNKINVGDQVAVRSGDTSTDLTDYAKNLKSITTYQYGGQNAPYLTDCSGWTQYIYNKFGITIPRVSRYQANTGTPVTLIACEQLNRKCFTMELDPKYCDVIIKRWESLTGKKAELLNA